MSRLESYKHPRLVQAALGYAEVGLRVFPLCKNSKVPLIERWPQRATCDGPTIAKWFESWPDANLAVATGGGLVAVDVDPRNGGRRSIGKVLGRRKLPDTAHALTGGGGDHYLFRVDGTLRVPTMTGWRPGIDIKGEGGYIAAEPSVHPKSGREYVWLRTPQQGIAVAPSWLVKLLTERVQPPAVAPVPMRPLSPTREGNEGPLLADAIERFPITGRGQRHQQMRRVVGRLLGKGYDPALTEAVAVAWTEHFASQGVVSTPMAEAVREVRTCINSTLRSHKFGTAVGQDHRANIGRIRLESWQESLLAGVISGTGIEATPPHCKRVTSGPRLCSRRHERPFVEALVVHFTYKITTHREAALKATNGQILEIMRDRHGVELDNTQFERLAMRYVTRPGRPARHYELLVQTKKGRPGVASEYELTGLRQLMPSEAPESSLARPTG